MNGLGFLHKNPIAPITGVYYSSKVVPKRSPRVIDSNENTLLQQILAGKKYFQVNLV